MSERPLEIDREIHATLDILALSDAERLRLVISGIGHLAEYGRANGRGQTMVKLIGQVCEDVLERTNPAGKLKSR